MVSTDGSPDSTNQLLQRNAIASGFSVLCGLIGIVDALMSFGEERRCLHDRVANTKVVKVTATDRAR